MRVLLLADRAFAKREHGMLRRLEIGLLDEGLRVSRAVPRGVPAYQSTGLDALCEYRDHGWSLGLASGGAQITEALESAGGPRRSASERPLDVVHAWGRESWKVAIDVAERTGAEVLLNVASARALKDVRSVERKAMRLESAPTRGIWTAPDEAMCEAVRREASVWPVRMIRWGVHSEAEARAPLGEGTRRGVCIVAQEEEAESVTSLLEGVGLLARSVPDVMIFVNAAAMDAHPELWKRSRSLGLSESPTAIPSMEEHRQLVLEVDAMAVPGAEGVYRTLPLEAMGRGRIVVAMRDELIDCYNEETCVLVENGTASEWHEAMERAIGGGEAIDALRERARAYVREHHKASAQISRTIEAYRSFRSGEPIAFKDR